MTRVCSYDRAGLGYSDKSSRPRTSKVMAQELRALLQSANIWPPYILVGHSMAGYNVRIYASLYPDEVSGMVLVDASHPDQEKRFPAGLKDLEGSWQRELQFVAYTMPFGIPRLLGLCESDASERAAEAGQTGSLKTCLSPCFRTIPISLRPTFRRTSPNQAMKLGRRSRRKWHIFPRVAPKPSPGTAHTTSKSTARMSSSTLCSVLSSSRVHRNPSHKKRNPHSEHGGIRLNLRACETC